MRQGECDFTVDYFLEHFLTKLDNYCVIISYCHGDKLEHTHVGLLIDNLAVLDNGL